MQSRGASGEAKKNTMEKSSDISPANLYQEREKRIMDAIQLKEPDKVPVVIGGTFFAAKYAGIPFSSAYYDPVAWKEAYKKTILDFEPDAYGVGGANDSGLALEAIDPKQTLWPGGNLPPDSSYQFIEGEYLKEDEYDLFLDDPTDFILRYYLPRAYGALEPLSRLPSLRERFGGIPALTPLFTRPEFRKMAGALLKAGKAQMKFRKEMDKFHEEMASIGFPSITRGVGAGGAPFETISSRLRGMRGAMIDMYKQPEKLLAASDKIAKWQDARPSPARPKKGEFNLVTGGGVLRGADGFMSKKQFEKFYWPYMKKSLQKTIALGYVCNVFCEGRCDDRLEYFLELPKKSLVLRFAETDMTRAKAILGNHHCIMGAVPSPLLMTGSAGDVDEYCKKLIKVCGKGGGFILRATTDSIEYHKPENIKAMVDSARKYGKS